MTDMMHHEQATDSPVVIGIAWRTRSQSKSFEWFCRAIEETGADYIVLDQVFSTDLTYDQNGKIRDAVDKTGALAKAAGQLIRRNSWKNSNAGDVLGHVGGVLFLGGEDVSPSLYRKPADWHGITKERDYNAERDVSDYLLMSYCLDHDIPVMGTCRGMQMLSVVSGAEMIQDIGLYFKNLSKKYHFEHRPKEAGPSTLRDFSSNEVHVKKGTLLYDIVQKELLCGCPCWHHQAVKNVDNTPLIVSGYTLTGEVPMIEVVERTDHPFAIGVQFHPEASIGKAYEQAKNREKYLDHDTALSFFRRLVAESSKRNQR